MSAENCDVQKLLTDLSNSDPKRISNALVAIRSKFIKRRQSLQKLIHGGLVPVLLKLLKCDKPDDQYKNVLDISLSILGNVCYSEEVVRKQVLKCNGVPVVANILCSSKLESVQNRCCRLVANLSLLRPCLEQIWKTPVVERTAQLLKDTTDKECQLTYLRAVRLLSARPKDMDTLLDKNCLSVISKLTTGDQSSDVREAALRALTHLSALRCCARFCSQVVNAEGVSSMVTVVTNNDQSTSFYALTCLLRLSAHGTFRPVFGAAGGIPCFVSLLQADRPDFNKMSILNVLCLCCKEAVNRVKLREAGALKIFLQALNSSDYAGLHERIISSLMCFLYDEASLEVLLECGMVEVLLDHLKNCAEFQSKSEDFSYLPHVSAGDMEIIVESMVSENMKNSETDTDGGKVMEDKVVADVDEGMDSKIPKERGKDVCGAGDEMRNNVDKADIAEVDDNSNKIQGTANQDVTEKNSLTDQRAVSKEDDNSGDRSTESDKTVDPSTESDVKPDFPKLAFSMDSPTYQPHTDWNMEHDRADIKCIQNFSDLPQYSSPTKVYSPLSSVSYYSPVQSSPEYSPQGSPVYHPSSSYSCDLTGPIGYQKSPCAVNISGSSSRSPCMSDVSFGSTENLVNIEPEYSDKEEEGGSKGNTCNNTCNVEKEHSKEHSLKKSGPGAQMNADDKRDEKFPKCVAKIASASSTPNTSHLNVVSGGDALKFEERFGEDPVKEKHSPNSHVVKEENIQSCPLTSKETSETLWKQLETCRAGKKVFSKKNEAKDSKVLSASQSSDTLEDNATLEDSNLPVGSSSASMSRKASMKRPLSPKSGPENTKRKKTSTDHKLRTTENAILMLLSRVSQMNNPTKYLVSREVLTCLINYLILVDSPKSRAARLISRVLRNPHCFERLLNLNIPLILYTRFLYSESGFSLLKSRSSVRESLPRSRSISRSSSLSSLTSQCDCYDNSDDARKQPVSNKQAERCGFSQTEDVVTDVAKCGLSLLEDLSIVTDYPYGRGVVAHMLSCGTEEDVAALQLTISYLAWTSGAQQFYLFQLNIFDRIQSILEHEKRSFLDVGSTDLGSLSSHPVISQEFITVVCGLHLMASSIGMKCVENISSQVLPPFRIMGNNSEEVVRESSVSSPPMNSRVHQAGQKFLLEGTEDFFHTERMENNLLRGMGDNPAFYVGKGGDSHPIPVCKHSEQKPFDLTFLVGQSTVCAKRSVLTEGSDIFAAMLEGHYFESSQSEIQVTHTSQYALEYLIHYLHGCTESCPVIGDIHQREVSENYVEDLLKMLTEAEKYLLSDLHNFLLNIILQHYITPQTCVMVFKYGVLHNIPSLCETSTRCLLVENSNVPDLILGFLKFLNCFYWQEFLLTLRSLFE